MCFIMFTNSILLFVICCRSIATDTNYFCKSKNKYAQMLTENTPGGARWFTWNLPINAQHIHHEVYNFFAPVPSYVLTIHSLSTFSTFFVLDFFCILFS